MPESLETDEQKQVEAEAGQTKPDPIEQYAQACDEKAEAAISASDPPACGLTTPHGRHAIHFGPSGAPPITCHGVPEPPPDPDELGSYEAMFDQYRSEQKSWLGSAQLPLVFHIRKLCRKLDADPDAPASLSSAYLQALHRLERQRPGSKTPAGSDGDLPGQGSIFDELD